MNHLVPPVLSKGESGPHKIQGIGAGFIPTVLNTKIYDEVVRVSDEDALETAKEIVKTDGIFVGDFIWSCFMGGC